MRVVSKGILGRVLPELERFVNHHILGLRTDPDLWPIPHDLEYLSIPKGIDRSDSSGPTWVLDREQIDSWHTRRTAIGAHAYRFAEIEEYDCGWRLVDVACRFMESKSLTEEVSIVTVVPPPPIYALVPVLAWTARRVAERLGANYVPDLFVPTAPLDRHPDQMRKLPVIPNELYEFARNIPLNGKRVLLLDWRWQRGHTITLLARKLTRAGAEVVRLAWLT